MIARRLDREPENDNFGALGRYVADASHEGEKLLDRWQTGCMAETYEDALLEIEATQDMNTRTKQEKTYHLIVSFRPSDEPRLTESVLRDVETSMATALGFEAHQRLCGVHKNTTNVHLHIAYNMIHPEKFTRHEPFRDFYKVSQVCRELETKHDLEIDNGVKQGVAPEFTSPKAATLEAHSGEQSFESYAKSQRASILEALNVATTWEDVHSAFGSLGMTIQPHANGLSVKDAHGKHAIKASALDRTLSQKKLETRFGGYAPPRAVSSEKTRYRSQPLQRGAARTELYQEYQAGIEERKTAFTEIKKQKELYEAECRADGLARRHQAQSSKTLLTRDRIQVLNKIGLEEAMALKKIRENAERKRAGIREKIPFWNWVGFLQHKASQGMETALEILRTQKNNRNEQLEQQNAELQNGHRQDRQGTNNRWHLERKKIQASNILYEDKMTLLAVNRMRQLAASNPSLEGFKWRIDSKGVILFTLPSGGLVRDAAKELTFSYFDPAARETAEKLAALKFGKNYAKQENKMTR